MTALLIDNLPLLTDAPNGIKKLRELILELAVRGKLVPQDPSDEPASELLKRIAEEKSRLVAEGKIKKQKPLVEVGEEAEPFELPAGWKWSSLAQVAFVNPRNAAADSLEVSFVPMTFIGTRFDDQHGQEPRLWGEVKQGFTHFAEGDIGVAKITPCFENSKACVFSNLMNGLGAGTTELHIVRPANGTLDPRYVLAYLKSPQFLLVGETKMTGTAGQKRLPKDFVEANPFPLPPLAEQHRIVAKVDELMVLCDRLDAQQADAGSAHAQLVQALLDSLTQASNATDFATNWQRLAEHFHTLFTTEPSIDTLKQTLLQLAVMGKLVPQSSDDEPASKLIERIQTEKQRYLAKSRTRKQKDLATDSRLEPPFEVPAGWGWQTIDDVLHVTGGVTLGRKLGDRKLLSKPYLRVANVQRGRLELDHVKEVEVPEDEIEKYLLQNGDLLITEGGDWDKVGRTAIWRNELPECLHQNHVFRARAVIADWEPRWAEMYLNSTSAREYFAGSSKQTTNLASINMTQLRMCAFPLPPLREQHRIVAKIDQLMALCDQLKNRLSQARQLSEKLASTVVERSLADDGQPAPATADQKFIRTLLAAEITHQLHAQRTFGQRKLQKVIYLAEHAAKVSAIQGDYLRDAAGPHDRQLMNQVEGELQKHHWYERTERETVGYAYRPLPQAGQHQQEYASTWSAAERATIEQVIGLMRDWDTDRCEMTVTLYAAWNDFVIEDRPVTDDAIVDEVMHSWNDTKLRFSKIEWLAVLAEMKKHKILMPTGFGKRTKGGMLSLPGFE